MTQIEREDLVERYLAGEMTATQESEFFLHVAVDDELQRTLKAFRIMDKAILNDRESAVAERSHYREQVFGLLAATSVAGGAAATTGASSAAAGGSAAGASGAGLGGALGAWKSVLISLVAGGLAIGTAVVVLPSILGNDKPAQQQSGQVAPQPAPVPGSAPAPTQIAPPNADAGSGSAAEQSGAVPSEIRESAETPAPTTRRSAPSGTGKTVVRQKTGTAETSAPAGQDIPDDYLKMPSKKDGEITIPTEVDKPDEKP